MRTAPLTTATRPPITSTVSALSDRELLRETRNLVRHERHLQGAVIDHLSEIDARGLYLERGFSSLFDYAVRELGYSDRGRRSAHRRHAAVRRSSGRAGGVARRLADAERRRGAAVGVRPAAAPRVDLAAPRRSRRRGRTGTERSGARLRAGRTVAPRRAGAAAAAGAGCGGAAATGASCGGRRREEPAGKSARQVRRMLADLDPELAPPADRVRPLGDGRYELKATIDAECQQGLEQLRGLLSHVDPRMTLGQLVGRLVKEGLDRHDPGPGTAPSARRQSARGREGRRPANSDAGAGTSAQRSDGEARRASGGHRGGAEDRPGRRPPRRSDAGVAAGCGATRRSKDAAIPAGAAPTPARAVRPIPDLRAAAAEHPARRRPAEPLPGRSRREPPLRRRSHALRAARFRPVSDDGCGNATAGAAATWIHRPGAAANSTHLIEIDHIVPHALGGGRRSWEPPTFVRSPG